MKRFFFALLLLLAVGLAGWFAVFRLGFYLNPDPDPPTAAFRAQAGRLQRRDGAGEWQDFTLRGVDLSASLPGHYATEFAPEEADYLRWFRAIGEMGANTLRVYTIMDDDFYNALYDYNTGGAEPLYLLQGIQVSDAVNDGKYDAFSDGFLGALLRDGRDAVDVIHGRKAIPQNESRGSGTYLRDLSAWTVGYLVGSEWSSETVAYTNHSAIRPASYQGTYFATTAEATPFEAMLAQVMDTIAAYETDKYEQQRLIAFLNDPANDPFVYDSYYAAQLSKYNQLDAQRVQPTQALASGTFAAYRLYDLCPDFALCLAPEQQAGLAPALETLDPEGPYHGYLELLAAYHDLPVVATGCAVSSGRGAAVIGAAPLTEAQQGEALVTAWRAAMDSGWSGFFLSSWQDTWERQAWNTAFAASLPQAHLWHDLQTAGQNYGLLAFDPGEEARVCRIDGDPGEWSPEDKVLETGGLTLSARSDAEGLYLLIQGPAVGPDAPLYLPIDVSEEVGATRCAAPALTFDRGADFLLCLDGAEATRLLVQERYDPLRENFLFEIAGEDPFVSPPAPDSPAFVPIGMALENDALPDPDVVLTAQETQALQALGVWETGLLVCGSGDPEREDYTSLADFCFGEDCVELRLPWLLLNVGDPATLQVHRDYYDYYGVRFGRVSRLWLGLGDGRSAISLSPLTLEGWTHPETHERLKDSYAVVRAAWKGGDHAETEH